MISDALVVHSLSGAHYPFIRIARYSFIGSSILLAILSATLIRSASNKISKIYSIQLLAIIILSLLSDFILQILWNPILLFPILCVARVYPLLPIPGGSDVYFKLWVASFTQIAPSYLACALYRHQAVQFPKTRWSLSLAIQRGIIAFVSILGLIMPILLHFALEPEGFMERYHALLSPSFDAFLSTTDCYDPPSLRPFGAMGALIAILSSVTSTVLVRLTRKSLRVASLLSDRTRSHHMAMIQVLTMQALVPTFCVALPLLAVVVAVLISGIEGSVILPHSLLVFSTHSFFQSIVLISTTPLYRKTLLQWLQRLKDPFTSIDRVWSRQSDNVIALQTIVR